MIIVLALNRIPALIGIFFGNALHYVYFKCLSSVVRSFMKICPRNFELFLNLYKKSIKNCTNWKLDLMQTNLLNYFLILHQILHLCDPAISVFHLCWHIYNLLSDSPWIITLVSWAVYLWTMSLFYWLFENWFVCGSFDLSWTT